MLNLIKNEFSKILHKISSLVMLIILLLVLIAIPVGGKVLSSLSDSYTFYSDLDAEIAYAESYSNDDPIYLEQLLKAQELGLTTSDLWGENSWKGRALTTAYEYRSEIYYYQNSEYPDDSVSSSEIAAKQQWFDVLIQSIEDDDWKYYYQISSEIAAANSSLSQESKDLIADYYNYLIEEDLDPDENPNTVEMVSSYASTAGYYQQLLAEQADGLSVDPDEFSYAENSTLIYEYAMAHHTTNMIYESNNYYSSDSYVYEGDAINSVQNGTVGFSIICILFLVVSGTIVSNEFSHGTIKFLLINPTKRQKIFWSKYLTLLILALGVTVFSALFETLLSGCIFGFEGLSAPLLLVENGAVTAHSGLLFVFSLYMTQFLELVICGTIAFMISSLFRNSGLAIALGIIIYSTGGTLATLASMMNFDFVRYTIFAQLDLTSSFAGNFLFEGMTLAFSLCVIAVHMFLFLFIARDAFVRRNV